MHEESSQTEEVAKAIEEEKKHRQLFNIQLSKLK
jgi:hypothetical protein